MTETAEGERGPAEGTEVHEEALRIFEHLGAHPFSERTRRALTEIS